MMDGLPGAGKSTLAENLVDRLCAAGRRADNFGEEQLFTRPIFAEVAHGFRTKQFATGPMFETAYRRYLAEWADGWPVLDWSAAGMTGDLPWAMRDRAVFVGHLRRVAELAEPRQIVLLNLCVDPRTATERAAAQRGVKWLRQYDALAGNDGITGDDPVGRITAWAERRQGAAEAERGAAREAGWTIVDLDASVSPVEVCAAAYRTVTAS